MSWIECSPSSRAITGLAPSSRTKWRWVATSSRTTLAPSEKTVQGLSRGRNCSIEAIAFRMPGSRHDHYGKKIRAGSLNPRLLLPIGKSEQGGHQLATERGTLHRTAE